eukprot:TRINITY_DN12163_c0_g1_i3.p3 TRINITY_DN12163_c0_g1~~TRINITY_DN12163_c0_g1_i3.p3  ORF type:complete len:170 (+),score=3.59 TRINITY_DN12163_c0_g1_i3:575-1084(+)
MDIQVLKSIIHNNIYCLLYYVLDMYIFNFLKFFFIIIVYVQIVMIIYIYTLIWLVQKFERMKLYNKNIQFFLYFRILIPKNIIKGEDGREGVQANEGTGGQQNEFLSGFFFKINQSIVNLNQKKKSVCVLQVYNSIYFVQKLIGAQLKPEGGVGIVLGFLFLSEENQKL